MRILVYYPDNAPKKIDRDWLYGVDIITELEKRHPEWTFQHVNGSTEKAELYRNVDVYLRPNRHDGTPIMVLESQVLGIPIVWSYEKGYYKEPDVDEIENRLRDIEKSLN